MKSRLLISLSLLATGMFAAGSEHLLLQKPTVNKSKIVFSFAGDLWSVSRAGGDATRLTTGPGIETEPIFSPDGTQIAFRGEYDGNIDVFVMPTEGGVPRRLTYHPRADTPLGWTPDGKNILFRSNRKSYSRFEKLFTIPVEGGFPSEILLPMGYQGSYSADGNRLAYVPIASAADIWKRYRGGRTTPIWIVNLADSKVIDKLPRENSSDTDPMWIGDKIFFLSNRSGPVSLFSYDLANKKITQLVQNSGFDIKSASAGSGAIVYEQFGSIFLYDLKSGQAKKVDIQVTGDLPSIRPSFVKVAAQLQNGHISPAGARAVFEARGEILSVPAEKGDIRNLTNTSGVAERDPSWSPDGRWIAYYSDESGEYQLHLRPADGTGEVRKLALSDKPKFYYRPLWSPDSKRIAYTDNALGVSYIDLEKKTPILIDSDTYETPFRALNPSWSPDSKWITYTKQLKNHLRAVFVYSTESRKATQISDGMSDAEYARFDKNGKSLYFTASTNLGLASAWLDLSSEGRNVTRSVYVAVLSKYDPSPIAPESDEEKAEPEKKDDKAKPKDPVEVRIDFENISQRILALPIPARDYVAMETGATGILFLAESIPLPEPGPPSATLYKFDLKTRKTDKMVDSIRSFDISHNGEKVLLQQGDRWLIGATATPFKAGEGALKAEAAEVRIDPRAEWKQMYHEVWRIERDFFYDPNLHGLNRMEAEKKYEPYLEMISSRADLNYLFSEMLGELSVGHLFVSGGAFPDVKRVPGGLLGADYKIENGRYRFARVYSGENWNPQLKAPLTQPGVNVVAGEYLLGVNGRDVHPPDNVYSFFEQTAGKSVTLRVGADPAGSGSREVVVVPVDSEGGLRNLAWIEDNRRKVDQLSGGRLAYVYLPDTAGGGYTNFNRYYFAQVGKEGAVIDERFNGGGQIADYVIDNLKRPLTNFFTTRYGESITTPMAQIFGPKAMIINEYAGSGGDAMPWLFRAEKVGTLVGKRTWGGLVGIFGFPALVDGGAVTAPNVGFYNLSKEWDVENHGVSPDVEVELDPAAMRAGHDPQLEKTVEILLHQLKEHPLPKYEKPAYPNYQKASQ